MKCLANHLDIRRPTNCKACGEFICNRCGGGGSPFGCKGLYRDQETGTTYFSCGRKISSTECCDFLPRKDCKRCDRGDFNLRYVYREEHPNTQDGPFPCEACICGLWSKNTCPQCHGEGAANGDCSCRRKIRSKWCDCAIGCSKCDMKETYSYGEGHENHTRIYSDGFCEECYEPRIADWKSGILREPENKIQAVVIHNPVISGAWSKPLHIRTRPTDPEGERNFVSGLNLLDEVPELHVASKSYTFSQEEIEKDVETVIAILRKYPPGTITF